MDKSNNTSRNIKQLRRSRKKLRAAVALVATAIAAFSKADEPLARLREIRIKQRSRLKLIRFGIAQRDKKNPKPPITIDVGLVGDGFNKAITEAITEEIEAANVGPEDTS